LGILFLRHFSPRPACYSGTRVSRKQSKHELSASRAARRSGPSSATSQNPFPTQIQSHRAAIPTAQILPNKLNRPHKSYGTRKSLKTKKVVNEAPIVIGKRATRSFT
jgi:hypothetical protein